MPDQMSSAIADAESLSIAARLAFERQDLPEGERLFAEIVARGLLPPEDLYRRYGSALAEAGRLTEARDLYRSAVTAFPLLADIHVWFGHIFEKATCYEEAIQALRRAVELAPGDAAYLLRLFSVLEKDGRLDEAHELIKEAHSRHPSDKRCLFKFLGSCQNRGEHEAIIASCRRALLENPNLPISVYRSLASSLKLKGRMSREEQWFDLLPEERRINHQIFTRIWTALNQPTLHNLANERATYPIELDLEEVECHFAVNSSYHSVCLERLSAADVTQLETNGLSLELLKCNRDYLIGEAGPSVEAPGRPEPDLEAGDWKRHIWKFDRLTQYQLDAVKDGAVYALCPWSGTVLSSVHSFPLRPRMAYRFVGKEVFYLLVLVETGEKYGFYFPQDDFIVRFRNRFEAESEQLNYLKTRCVSAWQKTVSYLSRTQSAGTAALIGGNPHMGHHLWNQLSALHRLVETGLWKKLDRIFLASPEYFGEIQEIYPEIKSAVIKRVNSHQSFDAVLESSCLAVYVSYCTVFSDLAARVKRVSRSKCPPTVLNQVEEAEKRFPVIWIGLRIHSRVWISQREGICEIIRALHLKYPSLGIIFDGHSRWTEAMNVVPPRERTRMAAEKQLVSEIKSSLHPDIAVYDIVGSTVFEAITWTDAADVYLAPTGTGELKPGIIGNIPGVLYGFKRYDWYSHNARENGSPCSVVISPPIEDTQDPSSLERYDTGHARCDSDWRTLLNEILRHLEAGANGP